MNTSISISWAGAAICLLIFAIIGLTMLKVIAAILSRIFSRSVAGGLPAQKQLAVPLLVVVLCVGLVAVKSSRGRSQVVADDTVVVDQSVQETMKNLSDARQQIHDVVNTRMIVLLDEETTSEKTGSEQAGSEQASGTAETSATDKQDEPKPQQAADADAGQTPSPASSETQSEPASPPAATASETAASETSAVAETPAAYLSAEERAKRAAEVGGLIRSLLSHAGAPAKPAVPDPSKAGVEGAESEDGGVMVFTLTPEDASQMFGPEMLSQLKSGLPKEVQAAFALVPLTSPVDSAVAPVKPFLAAGSLQSLADKLVTLLDPITGKSLPNSASTIGATTSSPAVEVSVATPTKIATSEPAWVRKPDGGRITVESKPVFEGGDPKKALADAVNEAYKQHAMEHFESLAPAVRSQLNRVQLKLDDQTARLCIVEEYVRNEQGVFGSEGEKPFQIAYALVQFPETVDIATDKQLRLSMQNDRLLALGLAIGFAWLGVVSTCFGIRTWTRRTGFRRLYTFPLFGIAVTFLLSTIAIVGATTIGDGPHVSSSDSKPIVISVPSV